MKKYRTGMLFVACDPFHYGHMRLFKRAKDICEKIYVVTESDEIIKREKNREPFTTENDRVKDLQGVKYIDFVYCRSKEKDKRFWYDLLKPEVFIWGDDWENKDNEAKHFGAEVVYLPRTSGIDSTYLRA